MDSAILDQVIYLERRVAKLEGRTVGFTISDYTLDHFRPHVAGGSDSSTAINSSKAIRGVRRGPIVGSMATQ